MLLKIKYPDGSVLVKYVHNITLFWVDRQALANAWLSWQTFNAATFRARGNAGSGITAVASIIATLFYVGPVVADSVRHSAKIEATCRAKFYAIIRIKIVQ